MLDGLDGIDWANLHHAYGSAADVPDLIRGLTSHEADIRKQVCDELCSNIYHQGTVYEATGYAVPFLAELARAELPDPDRVLVAFSVIVEGAAHQQRLSAAGRATWIGKVDPSAVEEAKHARRVIAALSKECNNLLGHRSRDWRYLAAVALAVSFACPDRAQDLLPRIRERLGSETVDARRLVWELARFALGEQDVQSWDAVEEALKRGWGEEVHRMAAAIREDRWDAKTPQEMMVLAMESAWGT